MKQTMKEAGYRYGGFAPEIGGHILLPIEQPGRRELWVANKNHASSGIRWRNTDLEFVSTLRASDAENEAAARYRASLNND